MTQAVTSCDKLWQFAANCIDAICYDLVARLACPVRIGIGQPLALEALESV